MGMSSVLFTHSYFYKLDSKQWNYKQPYPPLATILAAAVVRRNGFTVSLFDTSLRDNPLEITSTLQREKPKYVVIYDDGFNYLTKMCLTVMRDAAFAMAEEAKKLSCTVIISSSDSTDHYEKYLDHGVDYVVRGEGEETLYELLESLESDRDIARVCGLAFRKHGRTIVTALRPVMKDLDALPMPAWDLVDIDSYRKIWNQHHGFFSLNLATTRGCPYKCNWCAKPIYGNRYNARSPEHVVREIEWLLANHKPEHFWMSDDIFGLKPGWVSEFNTLVQSKKLAFTYKIQSRVDLLQDNETVEALRDSGAETIWVGAESGSQKILDAMDKGTTVDEIYKATRLLQRHGIKVAFFLQFGYLGETKEDIDATLRMVLELMPDEVGISVSYPLPGTKFYEKVKTQLKEKQNWSDSDDLAMMFHGTYGPRYYKVLHRYVHNRYRVKRGLTQVKNLFRSPSRSISARAIASMVYNAPLSLLHAYQLKRLSSHG